MIEKEFINHIERIGFERIDSEVFQKNSYYIGIAINEIIISNGYKAHIYYKSFSDAYNHIKNVFMKEIRSNKLNKLLYA